jgi:hypothetical protein
MVVFLVEIIYYKIRNKWGIIIIPLDSEGENRIEVKAQDDAGNSKVKEIKVHFKK